MKVNEVAVNLKRLDVCIIRDALKVFGSEGRCNSEEIEQLKEQFQKLLETMS